MPLRRPRSRRLAGLLLAGTAVVVAAGLVRAADHRDSTLLTANPAIDINDVYSFRSPADPSRIVLAMTVSPLIAPSEGGSRFFEPDALYQFKIDTNGDAVEDLVIQAVPVGTGSAQRIEFFGPAAPTATGARTRLLAQATPTAQVAVSTSGQAVTATGGNLTVFAGLRDDPFFFDLTRFQAIVAGQATSFRNPGVDAFAGFNALALVVELPASALGAAAVGVWGTTSRLR